MIILRAVVTFFLILFCLVWSLRAKADASFWNTPAVRACCSEADAVIADDWKINPDGSITATVTAPGPRTPWAPIGRQYTIPPEKILREPGNPLGRPLLFLSMNNISHVYCFAMGAGI